MVRKNPDKARIKDPAASPKSTQKAAKPAQQKENFGLRRIYIDRAVEQGRVAQHLMANLPEGVSLEFTEDARGLLDHYYRTGQANQKEDLLLYKNPAKWISGCPGSDGMVCCQYFVINFGLGCIFDCHYCYLQNFLNNPLMTLFGNLEDLFLELEERTKNKRFHFRIGTGEYTDSLALEPLTGIAGELVHYFADHPNATLELKTKSDHIESLLGLDHKGNTVLAWSINPQCVIDDIEDKTASLKARLSAARRAQEAGYKLAFHLDPLVEIADWKKQYKHLLEELFDTVNKDSIAWISVGSFRHAPGLREVIQKRFPNDRLTRSEMVQGKDGKLRYFKTIREEMYKAVKGWIEDVDPKLFLYLCMETQRMWQGVYGYVPSSAKNLDEGFERRRQYMLHSQARSS